VLTTPPRNASFLSGIISEMGDKYPGEADNEAGGPSMTEADGANITAVKRGLNNIAEDNNLPGDKLGG